MNEDLYNRSLNSLMEKRDGTRDNLTHLHYDGLVKRLELEHMLEFRFELLQHES